MENFMLDNAVDIFGITGTFVVLSIFVIVYFAYELGKKKMPDSYNTDKIQCDKYSENMDNKGIPYQVLQLTYCNEKPLSTNCVFWNSKNLCELTKNEKCKFFK